MTPALPPVLPQTAAPQSRDMAGALGIDAQRGPRAAREAETARALRPVDPVAVTVDPRLDRRQDAPVGPPPAFKVSLLQHLRDTAFDPPEPVPDGENPALDERTPERLSEPAPARERPAPYEDAMRPAAQDGVAPQLDLKV